MIIAPYIEIKPDISPAPVVRGTAWTVEQIVALHSEGLKPRDIRKHLQAKLRTQLTDDAIAAAVAYARDSFCTPKWFADLLPEHTWDPCSNPRSHIRAFHKCSLETGTNGLEATWSGTLFANIPFSNPLPWAEKLASSPGVVAAAFLVNVDNSTRWWRRMTGLLDSIFFFDDRIQFEPYPGIKTTTNNKPQALIAHRRYLDLCDSKLFECGSIYERRAA